MTLRPGDSIQQAVDEAPPGAVLCLPRGTWTETVVIRKPLTLQGAGATRTTVRGRDLSRPVLTVGPLEPAGEVVLRGIAFADAAGTCAAPGGCAHGLLVAGPAVVRAEDCAFSGNGGSGVAAEGEARVTLLNCAIRDNVGYGIFAQGEAEVVATSITVAGARSGGVWLAGDARLFLAASTVRGGEGPGAWVRDRSSLVASGSTFADCGGHGVWVRDGATAELAGCTIARARDAGAWAEGQGRLLLTDSTVVGTWTGVEVRGSASARLERTAVADVRWDGVKASGRTQVVLVGSTLRNGRGSGVRIEGLAQVELQANRIEGWQAQGVLALSGAQPIGEGNRMAGNGVDLVGNLSGTLRAPLREPLADTLRFPSPGYSTLQEAVDALRPGGTLVITEGTYTAGITVGKRIRIEGEGTVLLTARSAGEVPVASLVGGADLVLVGISLGFGSEGLILGADARAELADCVVSDHRRGIHASDRAEVVLRRSRLSRNSQGGMGLWGESRGQVLDCTFTANGVFGIAVGDAAQLELVGTLVTQTAGDGALVLRDRAEARIEGNTFLRNDGLGVALYHRLCLGTGATFRGRVSGGGNSFVGNRAGETCPAELAFLATAGGELDWRR